MYLRVTKRHNKDGSTVEYLQLAHNSRHPETGQSNVEVLHSFGRADEASREQLVRLCHSIARVCGLAVQAADPAERDEPASTLACLPSGLKYLGSRELGTVHVIEALWEHLGIGPILRELLKKARCRSPYERALLAMTANRLCEPESKLGVWDRWLKLVYMPSCEALKLDQLYEAMDFLHDHAEQVEQAVFFKAADLFDLEVDVIFYDTTTVSFSIDFADDEALTEGEATEGLRRRGHSKDGTWSPQVVVALAVTKQGFPVRSWIFPGNTADVTTIERVKADLKGWKLHRALFVADAGMNSEENRKLLGRACGKYLLAMRLSGVAEVKTEVLGRAGRFQKISENLQAKEVIVGEGEGRRRYILCFNPKEAERQRKHRADVVSDLEKELARHPSKDANQQWAKELMGSRRNRPYLRTTKGNKVMIDRGAIKEAARTDGKWAVLTNDDSLSVEDAALGYKSLLIIERCFRTLKRAQIQMGPMFHWLDKRIKAHVKICVLALQIECCAEQKSKRPWSQLQGPLRQVTAAAFRTTSHDFWQRSELTEEAREVLQALGITGPKQVLAVQEGASTA